MTAIANLPDLRPSLLLDFANSGRIDPRIQCTRASTATCFGPDGKLRTVAANIPRIDYDPVTGKCLGLLVEEARTNLRTASRQPTRSTGTVAGTATAIAPDGLPVTSIEDDPAYSGEHYINDLTLAVTTGQVYTQSIFVKAMPGAERQVVLRIAASGAGSQTLTFNVSDTACTATSVPSYPYGIQKCLNGWWRIWSQYTATGDFASAVFRVQLNKNNSGIYQGEAGKGLFLFGRQIELGASPTSYIPTEASAVTRASDSITAIPSLLQIPLTRGTWVYEAASPQATSPVIVLRDNTTEGHRLYAGTLVAQSVTPSAPVVLNMPSAINVGGFSYGDGTVEFVSGAVVRSSAVSSHPDLSNSRLVLGRADYGSVATLNGHIGSVAIYSRKLTTQQLQRLTA